ncbi:MAG: hypothetical protein ACKO1K_05900 [Burkholderiales bacterium]
MICELEPDGDEHGPKPVSEMTPEEVARVKKRMYEMIATGLILFAGPIDSRKWRDVGPLPEER